MDSLDEMRKRLRDLAVRHLGSEPAERVVAHAGPAVRLAHTSGRRWAGEGSRLGGNPILAPGTRWPRWKRKPLSLLALIDLAELTRVDDTIGLPSNGWLNVFYDAVGQPWGLGRADAGGWRVVHTPANGVETPAVADTVSFPEHPVRLSPILTLPGWSEPVVRGLSHTERYDLIEDDLMDFDQSWREIMGIGGEWPSGAPHHQLGGWPEVIQGPLWSEASSVRLLLQLDTDEALGWMWGDVGRLFFTIRDDDMAAGDFTRCWMTLQCN